MSAKKIVLAIPHGFCAGVERAYKLAEAALRTHPPPVYCFREIVHNLQVIHELAQRGLRFVPDLSQVPDGGTVLFSAHGVSPAVRAAARARRLNVMDATCPFVTKVHTEVRRYAQRGYSILLIGNRDHDEIIGVAGEAPDRVTVVGSEAEARAVVVPDPARVAIMTQTTLSEDQTGRIFAVLRERFRLLETPCGGDICYATRNRQQAVKALAAAAELTLVLGAENSSNSNRLVEVVRSAGRRACLISSTEQLAGLPLETVRAVGLTAGASTPESCVQEAVARLRARGFERVEELVVVREDLHFPLP